MNFQPVFWSFAVLGLFVWMLFRPYSTSPWKVLAFIALLAVEPFTLATLRALSRAYPLKYDYVLQALDQALGLTAFQISRLFTPWQRAALFATYQVLTNAMVVWYWIHLVIRKGEPRKLLYGYLIVFVVGGCLYGIVPAMGPRYAFGASFPLGNPNVAPAPALLEGYPNAMPSLHMTTALLLVLFTGRNRWLLTIGLLFLAGTAAATLAFEHYVIDLVVAVPFACFVAESARGRTIPAIKYLGFVLAWLGMIRFASPALIQNPSALRLLALFSVGLGVHAVAVQWMEPQKMTTGEPEVVLARP
jgi:hypothetical protein